MMEATAVRRLSANAADEPGLIALAELTMKRVHEVRDRVALISRTLAGDEPPSGPVAVQSEPGMGYGGIAGNVAQINAVLSQVHEGLNRIERVLGPARN